MPLYTAWNTAMPTTAARTAVTTGTSVKTMLQIATPSTRGLAVVKWGVRFATVPTAPIVCELVDTNVAATVTAHVAAGVQPANPGESASLMTLGTSATGYTASSEGSITATRTLDEYIVPIGVVSWDYEWSLGREPFVAVSRFLRVRMTTATAINATTYVTWVE